jgi:hypothetical protein
MAEIGAPEVATADPCCAPERQASCCEPDAKAKCCGRDEGCGCAAGDDAAQATDVREQGRER